MMSAAGSIDDDDDAAASIPWAASPDFPTSQDGGGGGIMDAAAMEEEDEDTRSPLRPTTSTDAAPGGAASAADPLSLPPGASRGKSNGGRGEIPEATLAQLEAAAFALPFAEFCDRLEAAQEAKGPAAKMDKFFFAGDLKGRLEVGAAALWCGSWGGGRHPVCLSDRVRSTDQPTYTHTNHSGSTAS